MELLVCIKQVPDTSEIKLDPVTNTLIRTGLPSIVNPFDLHALEGALQVKDQFPDARVTVLTMGPPQASVALKECLSMGADEAYLITDRAFAGADTLATSYTIAAAIKTIQEKQGAPFDMVFCGKQAIDGDTAQVGPQIAEELGMPQVTYVADLKIETFPNENEIERLFAITKREHESGFEVLKTELPLLVTAVKAMNTPRYPTLHHSIRANRYEVKTLTVADVDVEMERLGLSGSPTRVRKVYQPPLRSSGLIFKEGTIDEKINQLKDALIQKSVI